MSVIFALVEIGILNEGNMILFLCDVIASAPIGFWCGMWPYNNNTSILYYIILYYIILYYIICDLMGQNQSHVAIFSYGVKYTRF